MDKQKHILIVAGETSGDLNAAALVKAIKAMDPSVKFSAVGGTFLKAAGASIFHDIKGLSVIGLFDVLLKLPKFLNLKTEILKKIKSEKPDAIILVDFSGFNLRLAKSINKAIPVIYYISPQIWASRQGRAETIKKFVDKMVVFFEFEREFYNKYGISTDFVGHPLLDIVRPVLQKKDFFFRLNLDSSKITVALLPGSRVQEINNILPVMLKSAALINHDLGKVQFLIAKPAQVDIGIYNRIIGNRGLDLRIVEGMTYDTLAAADFCLVASGTATLEATIIGSPFAVIYKMNLLNYLLYRPQVKVPFIAMANIVAKKRVVSEFIQFRASPGDIAKEALRIIKSSSEAKNLKDELAAVRLALGEEGASARAAKVILDFLRRN